MSSDYESLILSMIEKPDCDATRLVIADWLEEHGQQERAEFIRVQCELAEMSPCSACCSSDCKRKVYEKREGELFDRFKTQWFDERAAIYYLPSEAEDAEGQYPDLTRAIVRRGFVAEVRAPLAALVGGECGRCQECHGRGFIQVGDGSDPHPDLIPCFHCPVATPGVLPAIAQTHPLEWVGVTDKRPRRGDGRIDDTFWWEYPPLGGSADFAPHYLPPMLFEYLNADEWYPNEHDALAALSRALIAWARAQTLSSSPAQGCEVAVG